MNEQERSQIERAKRLREQVQKIVSAEPSKSTEPPKKTETPRDFIHRRMTELDEKDEKDEKHEEKR